ncbi:glycosyltransferase family 2 protein [Thiomicrorhabdus xiamenensis]|uniref:Glycosyltransferase family 2 protein n=1 Tax=Thiomicrorhabdus xiamenensis TaxID=2739063 RepID=A0A7D4NRZ4_9GAMM|nr:glycosyltransferase family 2 protein [Thiomicrorhabdus xiamenensis]QKI89637.1 glycosyltransferase family 2 protein [Thiomicrorhabdus xiamenensis]
MNKYQTHAPNRYSDILCGRNVQLIHDAAPEFKKAQVLIAIPHKNQYEELARALISATNQTLVNQHLARIVVMDDNSEHDWTEKLKGLLKHPSITLLKAECGSPARARNLLLDWADSQTNISWVARLDADDEFHSEDSLHGLWSSVHKTNKVAAIGSNQLRQNGKILPEENIAKPEELCDHIELAEFIERFASGKQNRELPSCNLLLKTNIGLRYPNIRSAEDHWFVCKLLMSYQSKIAVCPYPIYSIYSLEGKDTNINKSTSSWLEQRSRLAYMAKKWSYFLSKKQNVIGAGLEGIAFLHNNQVIKKFFPWAITDSEVDNLKKLISKNNLPIPKVRWFKNNGLWQYQTDYLGDIYKESKIPKQKILTYLKKLYKAGVSTLNVKRENLQITPSGELQYIDIGKDIQPLSTSNYRDMCARLYSIGILGNKDEEVVRRYTWRRQDEALKALPGFEQFYSELIASMHPQCTSYIKDSTPKATCQNRTVTLLIKCCGQDAKVLTDQVEHITTQLCYPTTFSKTILLIDSHQGAFLRQYSESNLSSVIEQAQTLKKTKIIDEFLVSPNDLESIKTTYEKWFACSECTETHTSNNAPLFPQIWGFDQITTPYVLQCDVDILIGRRNWQHSYLDDMLEACSPENILSVGFNISKRSSCFNPYRGEPGEFAAEVRFGLLDLRKIHRLLPIKNPISGNKLSLTWHRALQNTMREKGYRALRGGDPSSFYVHPKNEHKCLPELGIAKDLISQGREPDKQYEQFDWIPEANWKYDHRNEPVVFLLKGRHTNHALLQRCLNSLRNQKNQDFGIILLDDASGPSHNWSYPLLLGELQIKTTLIRRSVPVGRMPNFLMAVKEVCQRPETLIAVLDQDDCLMQNTVVDSLLDAQKNGSDLIQMPMYRPNKPINLYRPSYKSPREEAGANVWSHLRVFTKYLFEQVPEKYFKRQDKTTWFDSVTDYLTMLPMAEIAENPTFLDTGYTYWHSRKDRDSEEKQQENLLIEELLSMPSLFYSDKFSVVQVPEFFEDEKR